MNKTYLQDQKNKVHRKIRKKLEKKRKQQKELAEKKKIKKLKRMQLTDETQKFHNKEKSSLNLDKLKIVLFNFIENFSEEKNFLIKICEYLDQGKTINTEDIDNYDAKQSLQNILFLLEIDSKKGNFKKLPNTPDITPIVKLLIDFDEKQEEQNSEDSQQQSEKNENMSQQSISQQEDVYSDEQYFKNEFNNKQQMINQNDINIVKKRTMKPKNFKKKYQMLSKNINFDVIEKFSSDNISLQDSKDEEDYQEEDFQNQQTKLQQQEVKFIQQDIQHNKNFNSFNQFCI